MVTILVEDCADRSAQHETEHPPKAVISSAVLMDPVDACGVPAGMLVSRLEQNGNWLFRHRSYLPILLALPMGLACSQITWWFGDYSWQLLWGAVCLLLSGCGLLVRILTVGFVPRGTSGRNTTCQKAAVLNTTGMYSVVRNPLYLGNSLIWCGVIAYPRNGWFCLGFGLLFWLYYERIIAAEERFLLNRFGSQYADWVSQTPVFVPNLSLWVAPQLAFCLRTVLRREYPAVLGITVGFLMLDGVAHLVVENRWSVHTSWLLLATAGVVLFFVLRAFKNHTQLLRVEGRSYQKSVHKGA